MTVMQTRSGLEIDLLDPKPEQICIEDIAYHLSMLCRFTGAVEGFYSVAQHCILVSKILPPDLALAGLLHDAHEAYLGDISSPLKKAIKESATGKEDVIGKLEYKFDNVIAERFSVPVQDLRDEQVKKADLIALATEKRDLMPPNRKAIWEMLKGVSPSLMRAKAAQPGASNRDFLERAKMLLG